MVTRGAVVETVDATGTLQAVTTVQVGTQVSGTIKTPRVDFNARVRRGQVVAELEPSLDALSADISTLLRRRHRIPDGEENDFMVRGRSRRWPAS